MAVESITKILLQDTSTSVFLTAAILVSLAYYVIYRSYLDPLSHVPGPLICRLTVLWAWYHSYIGDESTQISKLHEKYGSVVRIGPRHVVFSDGRALAPIYSEKGGFLKATCYGNFDFGEHATIFSTSDPKYRSVRSKAVMPMFSMASIREQDDTIEACVGKFIQRLRLESEKIKASSAGGGGRLNVDILNLTRGMAIDVVCTYLFGKDYGGTQEQVGKLSASGYVETLVLVGNTFFLPNWLFLLIANVSSWLWPSPVVQESERKVADFTQTLVKRSSKAEDTYQSRLLKAGIAEDETDVQMRDVIFAGTDTTGTSLATLIWQLAKHPYIYRKLQKELALAERENPGCDPQNVAYLQAVVREGLRLSMANPTRFPREVPPSGWTYVSDTGREFHMPARTQVGLSPHTLHLNPKVFLEPMTFAPERWTSDPTPEMYRDWIPFGTGPRQCIARNLAMAEVTLALRALAKSDVLSGARPVKDTLQKLEWFNTRIVGDRIDLTWQ